MSSPAKTVVRAYQNYINGQWVKSASGEMFPVYDPSTEEVIAHVASGTAADVDRAVKAARVAFDDVVSRVSLRTQRLAEPAARSVEQVARRRTGIDPQLGHPGRRRWTAGGLHRWDAGSCHQRARDEDSDHAQALSKDIAVPLKTNMDPPPRSSAAMSTGDQLADS